MIRTFFIGLTVFLFCSNAVFGYKNTLPNNKFGIHLAQPQSEDIAKAAKLVNSQGGKWGYITLVMQEDDRDAGKWQEIFNKLRELQLIPIVRLATKPEGANWRRPEEKDADAWVIFLNSLNWVVENRYVVLFNEPNHASEWGGTVDAIDYAKVSKTLAQKLKKSNSDYVLMLGGLDASAPSNKPLYEDEAVFLTQIVTEITARDFNQLFDGLASHSYPNPGFLGSPWGSGRGSVRTYQWELELLRLLGVKELPVFISETGWNGRAIARELVADNFQAAFTNIWLPDDRVAAVTPFILNYQSEPFLQFSWLQPGGEGVYPEYERVEGMSKLAGNPIIREKGSIAFDLPHELVAESSYHLFFRLANVGQAIWSHDDGYRVALEGIDESNSLVSYLPTIKPLQQQESDFFFQTSTKTGSKKVKFILYKDDQPIIESRQWQFQVVPLPALQIQTKLFPKIKSTGDNFQIQIYNNKEELIYQEENVVLKNGRGILPSVRNVALNQSYRVVLLKEKYLPTQIFISFQKGENIAKFRAMLPFDPDGDGTFKLADLAYLLKNLSLLSLFLP